MASNVTHDSMPDRADSEENPNPLDWGLGEVVIRLGQIRTESLAARHRNGRTARLPSRKALSSFVEDVCAALFPNRLSERRLAAESVDFFVGHTLDRALRGLHEQVLQERLFGQADSPESGDSNERASSVVRQFAAQLPVIRALLDSDILAAFHSDPAARSMDEVLACYPGVRAVMHYRIAHSLHSLGAMLLARMISEIAHSQTGVEIHPAAQIAGSFFIDHGTGVVIGETARIGSRVKLHHAVTLAARSNPSVETEKSDVRAQRHPIVEDDVTIYAGATLVGPIRIGRGSVIGGNVWLTTSVSPGSTISQAEVRSEAFHEGLGI